MKAFLFIPHKLMITLEVAQKDPVCAPIFIKHPEVFKDHYDAEYLSLAVFVMHQCLIGEKSFWFPFWQVTLDSDLPMRWEEDEIAEL